MAAFQEALSSTELVPEMFLFTTCIFSETAISKCPSRPTAHNGGSMTYKTQLHKRTANFPVEFSADIYKRYFILQLPFLETKRQRHLVAPALLGSFIARRGRVVSTGRWPDAAEWRQSGYEPARQALLLRLECKWNLPSSVPDSCFAKVPGNCYILNKGQRRKPNGVL
jgi:hypothetical protein